MEKIRQLVAQMGQGEHRSGDSGTASAFTPTMSGRSASTAGDFVGSPAFVQRIGQMLRQEVFEVTLLDYAPRSEDLHRLGTILRQCEGFFF